MSLDDTQNDDSMLMNRWILLYCSLVGTKHECMTVLCCCISIWTTATCIMVVCCCVCLSLTFRVVLLVSRTVLKLQIHNIYPISPINDETLRISSSFLFIIAIENKWEKLSFLQQACSFNCCRWRNNQRGSVHDDCIIALKKPPHPPPPQYSTILWGVLEVLEKKFWIAQ